MVWKVYDFQWLRIYIKLIYGVSRSKKFTILSILEAPNFDFLNFCSFWTLNFTKSTKFKAPQIAKTAVLGLLDSPQMISRKIWMTEKAWNFYIVCDSQCDSCKLACPGLYKEV